MRSRSIIDEIRVAKDGTVSITIIPPDEMSREPKIVAEYIWSNEITDRVVEFFEIVFKRPMKKVTPFSITHRKNCLYSYNCPSFGEKGTFVSCYDSRIQSAMDVLALLVENDLLHGRDQMHERLAKALRFLWMNYEGEHRSLALRFAVDTLSKVREGHEAWYHNAVMKFEEQLRKLTENDITKVKIAKTTVQQEIKKGLRKTTVQQKLGIKR